MSQSSPHNLNAWALASNLPVKSLVDASTLYFTKLPLLVCFITAKNLKYSKENTKLNEANKHP